ncbi:hypothetical protein EDB85DRAFT_1893898 [Lactarius pseudohatsudake]|nr:hypothetical protein EDB85DRAFT_1893898 [Lactarius pseudohatsudake]
MSMTYRNLLILPTGSGAQKSSPLSTQFKCHQEGFSPRGIDRRRASGGPGFHSPSFTGGRKPSCLPFRSSGISLRSFYVGVELEYCMALAATLSAAPSLGTRTLTGVKLNSVARGYPTTRIVDECSFPHVMAGGHVVRWVGHFRPVASPCPPFGAPPMLAAGGLSDGAHLAAFLTLAAAGAVVGTRFLFATILTLFPQAAPALSRKFPVTLAVVANSAPDRPDTSTLAWHYGAATMDNGQDPRPRVSLCVA